MAIWSWCGGQGVPHKPAPPASAALPAAPALPPCAFHACTSNAWGSVGHLVQRGSPTLPPTPSFPSLSHCLYFLLPLPCLHHENLNRRDAPCFLLTFFLWAKSRAHPGLGKEGVLPGLYPSSPLIISTLGGRCFIHCSLAHPGMMLSEFL